MTAPHPDNDLDQMGDFARMVLQAMFLGAVLAVIGAGLFWLVRGAWGWVL